MGREGPLAGAVDGHPYAARLPADRTPSDHTPRVVPHHPAAAVPLEADRILWRA